MAAAPTVREVPTNLEATMPMNKVPATVAEIFMTSPKKIGFQHSPFQMVGMTSGDKPIASFSIVLATMPVYCSIVNQMKAKEATIAATIMAERTSFQTTLK